MSDKTIYTVVRSEADGYRTTPNLKRMTEEDAREELKTLKARYPYQSFVVLKEAYRARQSNKVTVETVAVEVKPKKMPKPKIVSSVVELRKGESR